MFINPIVYMVTVVSASIGLGTAIVWAVWNKWGDHESKKASAWDGVLIRIAWAGKNKWGKRGILFAIIVAAISWGGFQAMAGHIYIVEEENRVDSYRTFGSIEYLFHTGKKIIFPYDPLKVTVVNDSHEPMILEELIYSANDRAPEGDIFFIDPYSGGMYSLPFQWIDYLPGDRIPSSIEEYGSRDVSKYWLHHDE